MSFLSFIYPDCIAGAIYGTVLTRQSHKDVVYIKRVVGYDSRTCAYDVALDRLLRIVIQK